MSIFTRRKVKLSTLRKLKSRVSAAVEDLEDYKRQYTWEVKRYEHKHEEVRSDIGGLKERAFKIENEIATYGKTAWQNTAEAMRIIADAMTILRPILYELRQKQIEGKEVPDNV